MASGKLVDQIWGLAVFISTIFPVPISNLTYIDSVVIIKVVLHML